MPDSSPNAGPVVPFVWAQVPADELARLRAVAAAPADPVARAAYADWLEGAGRAAEAELHRVSWRLCMGAVRAEVRLEADWGDTTRFLFRHGGRPHPRWDVYGLYAADWQRGGWLLLAANVQVDGSGRDEFSGRSRERLLAVADDDVCMRVTAWTGPGEQRGSGGEA